MDIIPDKDVYKADTRNTKKTLLPTDAICIKCGVIFNSTYEDKCVICEDDEIVCTHSEFISGRESVDLRILLDYHIDDLRALCEIHGCPGGSRSDMTICILKKLHSSLDKRIDNILIRKMIKRNHKRFRFWRDIEDAIARAKKSERIVLIDAADCLEMTDTKK